MAPEIHPLGVVLSLGFVIALTWLIWWMLHPPIQISATAAKARRSVFAVKRILVPVVGHTYSERGVELACRLGEDQKAEILLAYVLEVSRTMPLGIPLIDAEAEANRILDGAETIVKLHNLISEKLIRRARLAGEEIARMAMDRDVDMIVLGINPRRGIRASILGTSSDTILRNAPCEVIIDKLPT